MRRSRKRQDRKEKVREVWMLSKFVRHLLPRIVLPLNPIFAVLPSYSAISFFYLQLSCNSLAGVHGSSTSFLAHFCLFIRFPRHALYLMNVICFSPVCRVSHFELKGVCTLAKREPIKIQKST